MQGGGQLFCRPALPGPGVWIWMERSLCAGRIPYPPGSRRHERPPYGAGETRRPPGKMQFPRPLQTHVGDDARTAPAGAFRRPTGPQVRLLGRRSSRGVRGGAGFGRGMPLSYMPSGDDRPNGLAAAAQANVGRDALIPPSPAAAGMFPILNRQGAAGVNARPTDPGKHGGQPGKCNPRGANRRGRIRISARFTAAQGSAGGINPAPTNKFYVLGQPRRPLIPHS